MIDVEQNNEIDEICFMIFICNAAGQLCNRIILFAHVYATGLCTNQKVVHCFANDLRRDFCLDDKSNVTIAPGSKKQYTWIEKILCKVYGDNFRQRDAEKKIKTFENYKRGGIHIVDSWYYRDYESLFKKRDQVRQLFRPSERYMSEIEAFKRSYLSGKEANLLVGVHIRRGDYKTWRGGRFYYSDNQYKNWMNQFADSAKSRCTFFLCSNETINTSIFMDKKYNVVIAPGDVIKDLYLLAGCDYIMGAPSTYSWWAAFYGDKQYCTLHSHEQKIDVASFRKVRGEEFNPNKYIE